MVARTVSLSGVLSASAFTTHDVFPRSSQFKMPRVEACSVFAEVVKSQPVWNGAYPKLIGDSMDVGVAFSVMPYLAIAISRLCSMPLPTPTFQYDSLLKQTLNEWFSQVLTPVKLLSRRRNITH